MVWRLALPRRPVIDQAHMIQIWTFFSMSYLGLIAPNTPGHLNPMTALSDALRRRGHRVTYFLLGDPPSSVTSAGFEVIPLGGTVFRPEEYRSEFQRLGGLEGRAALHQTLAIAVRSAKAILNVGPTAVGQAGISALIVDQASIPSGTVADQLGLPFATVCNALILHSEPSVPPFFTPWLPRNAWYSRLRNRAAWAGLYRLYNPLLSLIREKRRTLGLSVPSRIEDTWSNCLQISQQPDVFEFPRQDLPEQFRFVGPLRLASREPPIPFPWNRLDDGRPLIYASLGTIQNRVAQAFRMIAEACDHLGGQLVISTGGADPEELGKLAGEPIVVAYAPQRELIQRATLVITHAGLNTALDSLSEGVPMVALPVTNEQPGVAARVRWLGAGEAIALKHATPARLRRLVVQVLSNSSYRDAARRVQDVIRDCGGAALAAELIEQSLGLERASSS